MIVLLCEVKIKKKDSKEKKRKIKHNKINISTLDKKKKYKNPTDDKSGRKFL